jgi:hypothetical protein
MADKRKTLGLKLHRKRERVDSDSTAERNTRRRIEDRDRRHSDGDKNQAGPSTSFEDSGIGPSIGFTVPGFNYLGPGNPLDNGPPTNRVDEVARQHDLRYSEAQLLFEQNHDSEEVFKYIQEADDSFLVDLSEIEPTSYTESFGKIIGKTGIGLKRGVENILHTTLYPSLNKDMDTDAVDGESSSNFKTVLNQAAIPSGVISINEGITKPQIQLYKFKKHFNIAFDSHPMEFKKTVSDANNKHGITTIIPYIHSLPWQMLYFYITEREFNSVINSCHSAYVDTITIKIFNMGVSSTTIQSSGTSLKTISTNQYLGVWKGFEQYGPVSLGDKITPEFLYGKTYGEMKQSTGSTANTYPSTDLGAISEIKRVDNRISYPKITSTWQNNKDEKIEESNMLPPPLLEMATIVANASTNTGLIFQHVYKPKDGLFHNRSSAFHNASVIQHKPYEQNIDIADNGKISDAKYIITSNVKNNTPAIKYEDCTVNNMFFRSLRASNQLEFMDGLGIGLFPFRMKDDTLLDTTLNVYIQTEITIKGESFGGSVHFGGKSTGPQCNPNRVYLVHEKKKFGNAYASDGLPTLGNVS